jgi:predicted transcriptional regulator
MLAHYDLIQIDIFERKTRTTKRKVKEKFARVTDKGFRFLHLYQMMKTSLVDPLKAVASVVATVAVH